MSPARSDASGALSPTTRRGQSKGQSGSGQHLARSAKTGDGHHHHHHHKRSSGKQYVEVAVPCADLPRLCASLRAGGGVRADFDVGAFREGMLLLAGGSLDLESFDIIGLEPGDELDRVLGGVVQEAIASLADDEKEARLLARPLWMKHQPNLTRLQRLIPSACRSCCKKRKWRRRRGYLDRVRWLCMCIESAFMRLFYLRTVMGKQYDIFVTCQASDQDLANWLNVFCANRSMTVCLEPPVKEAREMYRAALQERQERRERRQERRQERQLERSASAAAAGVGLEMSEEPKNATYTRMASAISGSSRRTASKQTAVERQSSKMVAAAATASEQMAPSKSKVDFGAQRSGIFGFVTQRSGIAGFASQRSGIPGFASQRSGVGFSSQRSGVGFASERSGGGGPPRRRRVSNFMSAAKSQMSKAFSFFGGSAMFASEFDDGPFCEMPCVQWLERRKNRVQTSRLVIAVMSPNFLDNLCMLLDCVWAWQAGVAVLPVRRYGTTLSVKPVRKAMPWLFRLRVGAPFVGQGASRREIAVVLQRSFVLGLRMARRTKKSGSTFPKRMADVFGKACQSVQAEIHTLEDAAEEPAAEEFIVAIDDDRPARPSIAQDDAAASPTDAAPSPTDVGAAAASVSRRKSAAGQPEPENNDEDEAEQGPEVLPRELEERVYGVVTLLALHHADLPKAASVGAMALRAAARREPGAESVSQLSGVEVLTYMAQQSCRKYKQIQGAMAMAQNQSSYSRSMRSTLRRGATSSSRAFRAVVTSARSKTTTFSESSGRSGRRRCTLRCCLARRGGEEEDSDSSPGSPASTRSPMSGMSPRISAGSSRPRSGRMGASSSSAKGTTSDELATAEICFAALRNLACRGLVRKDRIFEAGAALSAIAALRHFSIPETQYVRQGAAALLRNLTAGQASGLPRKLANVGLLDLAEEELVAESQKVEDGANGEGSVAGEAVRKHLLASVQNLALATEERHDIFPIGTSERWMSICANMAWTAQHSGQQKALQSALGALANLAILRSAEAADMALNPISEDPDDNASKGTAESRLRAAKLAVQAPEDQDADENPVAEEEDSDDASWGDGDGHPMSAALRGSAGSWGDSGFLQPPEHEAPGSSRRKRGGRAAASASGGMTASQDDEPWSFDETIGLGAGVRMSAGSWGEESQADDFGASEASGSSSSDDDTSGSEWSNGEAAKTPAEAMESEASRGSWGASKAEIRPLIRSVGSWGDGDSAERSARGGGSQDGSDDVWSDGGDARTASHVSGYQESAPTEANEMRQSLELAQRLVPVEVLKGMLNLLNTTTAGAKAASASMAGTIAALCNFAQDVHVERSIGDLGGVQTVLSAMARTRNLEVQEQSLRFFWNMSWSRTNQARIFECGVLKQILRTLGERRKPEHATLHEQGFGVIRNLATGCSAHKRTLFRAGVIGVACRSLATYPKEGPVCAQAAAVVHVLGDRAPPVAEQAIDEGAIKALSDPLKFMRTNFALANELLHAIECAMVSPRGLVHFVSRRLHFRLVDMMRADVPAQIHLRICRVFAVVLSHRDRDIGDGDWAKMLEANGSDTERSDTKKDDKAPDEAEKKGSQKKAQGKKDTKKDAKDQKRVIGEHATTLPELFRAELSELRMISMFCMILDIFSSEVMVCEAAAIALQNLVVDIDGDEVIDHRRREPQRKKENMMKADAGEKCRFFLQVVQRWVESEERRDEAACFVGHMFTFWASLCLNPSASLHLHRHNAAEKVLRWMQAYKSDATVLISASNFLKNFSVSRYRVREAIVWAGGVGELCSLMSEWMSNVQVLEALCCAMHNLATAPTCWQEARTHEVIPRIFEIVDKHPDEADLQTAAFALLWNFAVSIEMAHDLINDRAFERIATAFKRFNDRPGVLAPAVGLMRNLLSSPDVGRGAAKQCMRQVGYRTILDMMWGYGLPQESASAAAAPPTNDGKAQEVASDRTILVEQILAAMNNIAKLPRDHNDFFGKLVEEMIAHDEAKQLRFLLESNPSSPMVQYQGFGLISHLLIGRRRLKVHFVGFGVHVTQMISRHQGTPVSDTGELLLEEVA